MRRVSGWNFGQVPAVIAELAHNLLEFLQANSETSASEREGLFTNQVEFRDMRIVSEHQ
jgi:hypothetical protein